jgi:hypothetical protein
METDAKQPPALAATPSAPSDDQQRPPVPDTSGSGQPSRAPESGEGRDAALRALASIGANVTVLTALLIYFGWRRSETQARVLGIDESILGMSTRDYVVRSVGPLLAPLVVVGTAGLGWLWLHAAITRALARGQLRPIRITARVLAVAWLWLPLACALILWRYPTAGYLAFPLSFAVGILLAVYGTHLRALLRARDAPDAVVPLPSWQAPLTKALVAVLVTISLFWSASNYAEVLGEWLARNTRSQLGELTRVVVYSPKQLLIDAPAVKEELLGGPDAAYRYRYTGLRLLEHTGGRYFLISDGWTEHYGVVVMLADTDPVRLEFVRDLRQP